MAASVERAELWPCDIEVLRVHYAKTLRTWREGFEARRADVEAMYNAQFTRMRELHLAASEVGFSIATNNVLQVQLARKRDAMPLTRYYLPAAEEEFAAREKEILPRLRAATTAAFGERQEDEAASEDLPARGRRTDPAGRTAWWQRSLPCAAVRG